MLGPIQRLLECRHGERNDAEQLQSGQDIKDRRNPGQQTIFFNKGQELLAKQRDDQADRQRSDNHAQNKVDRDQQGPSFIIGSASLNVTRKHRQHGQIAGQYRAYDADDEHKNVGRYGNAARNRKVI
ncbi:hypothetical protein OMP40_14400 [Cohnella rhizosphaerae]|uniref:Uncharacterized protein n=1 Tax=Cohnella rhizosphaerae TaxID=1457232 RepID=A0A9X4KT74_9BACL|nr:hypothetical protein [Cohnella rhizosphaerae]MDG0810410.1 hypothetical protein [Cohnella rhizosphaerae]